MNALEIVFNSVCYMKFKSRLLLLFNACRWLLPCWQWVNYRLIA